MYSSCCCTGYCNETENTHTQSSSLPPSLCKLAFCPFMLITPYLVCFSEAGCLTGCRRQSYTSQHQDCAQRTLRHEAGGCGVACEHDMLDQ